MTYYPTFPEWRHFVTMMEEKGFRKPSKDEERKYTRGYGLVPPRSRQRKEPGELCMIYEPPRPWNVPPHLHNDYRVVVWTTKRDGGWVTVDSAWVLIVNDRGSRVHTSRPIIRKGPAFLFRVFTRARDARWRVLQRPYHCGQFMLASHRYDRTKDGRIRWKSSVWRCAVHQRAKTHVRDWNDLRKPFPPEEARRIEREWRKHERANKKTRDAGKEPYAALQSRIKHPWRVEEVPRNAEY